MVKFTAFFLLFLFACAGPSISPGHVSSRKHWSQKLDGFITDLNISSDGARVLVALSPDFESSGGNRHYQLVLLNSEGKILWRFKPEAPIREQIIAPDGTWAVFSSYDDKLTAIDLSSGKKIWTAEGTCKPYILSSSKKILCFHDDDADSNSAFDVYSGEGVKLLTYPIVNDSLGLKVSPDQQHFALALTHGQVIFFDSEFRALWQVEVPGEIVDLDISLGPVPQVAVLLRKAQGLSLFLLDAAGKELDHAAVPLGGRKVFFLKGAGTQFLVQGFEKGRQLASLLIRKGDVQGSIQCTWSLEESLKAETVLSAVPGNSFFILQEDSLGLRVFDLKGHLRGVFSGAVEGESVLYAQAFASGSGFLALATDKGEVSLFEVGIAER